MAKQKERAADPAAEEIYAKGRAYYQAQDFARAAACFLQAAQKGHPDAENCLGCCYEAGQGVVRDFVRAADHYRRAAWRGNAYAQYNLGNCYAEGRGVARDDKAAFEWFRLSAENGYAPAQRRAALALL